MKAGSRSGLLVFVGMIFHNSVRTPFSLNETMFTKDIPGDEKAFELFVEEQ